MKPGWLIVGVMVKDDADVEHVASGLFDFLASDPDDRFPDIVTVDSYEGREIEP